MTASPHNTSLPMTAPHALGQDEAFVRLLERAASKRLIHEDLIQVHHLERYSHRISIDGSPRFYRLAVGRKRAPVPDRFIP